MDVREAIRNRRSIRKYVEGAAAPKARGYYDAAKVRFVE